MDLEFGDLLWRFGWLFSLLISGLLSWLIWSLRRQFLSHDDFIKFSQEVRGDLRSEFDVLREQDAAVERRVAKLEVQMQQVPDKETMHDLQICVARTEGTMSRLGERLDGTEKLFARMERALQRQEDFLLNHRKGGGNE
mgnify:CR=1 FL=1